MTIAMTLRNSAKTLSEALEGITKLDYDTKQLELVFVDGGSKDGSLDILENFRARHKEGYGMILVLSGDYDVTQGRNTCIKNSEGEFVLFIDSDVVVPADLLRKVEPLFTSDEKIAFINIPCIVEKKEMGWVDKFYTSMGETQGMSCAALRMSALREVGPYFTGFSRAENPNELMIRLKKRGYKYVVSKETALHMKQKPRGFLSYVKVSFYASVQLHYQEIKAGRRYLLVKYAYYTVMLLSPLLALFSPPLFVIIFAIGVVYYLVKSGGNLYSLPALFVVMILPIGMLYLIIKKAIGRSE